MIITKPDDDSLSGKFRMWRMSLAVKEGLRKKLDMLKYKTITCWYYNWGIVVYFPNPTGKTCQ